MDKVEKVSIGGYAFTLDTAAYNAAKAYLTELENYYSKREGGTEIMEGIEERFAELLLERTGSVGVGTLADIDAIENILGRPEVLEHEDEEAAPEKPGEKPKRRLFRDTENKVIGGVCSGLAAFANIDVSLIRIVWTLLALATMFGGFQFGMEISSLFFVGIYLIMWICVPAAKTVRQRWEMRGESGKVDEVSRIVSDNLREVGATVSRASQSTAAHRLGRVFLGVIGFMFLMGGITMLTVSAVAAFVNNPFGLWDTLSLAIEDAWSPTMVDFVSNPWIRVLGLLAVALPGIGMMYGGLQLIFNFRSPKWRPGLILFILWMIVLVALAVLTATFVVTADYSWV